MTEFFFKSSVFFYLYVIASVAKQSRFWKAFLYVDCVAKLTDILLRKSRTLRSQWRRLGVLGAEPLGEGGVVKTTGLNPGGRYASLSSFAFD